MDDPGGRWIEFTTQDGRTSRMRVEQIDTVTRANGGDTGVIHTSLGELIRVLNVTHVLKQWQHRLLFIVARQATSYHGYLQRAFADVDWTEVIFDRRRGERRQQESPWMVERRARGRRARPDEDRRDRLRSHREADRGLDQVLDVPLPHQRAEPLRPGHVGPIVGRSRDR